MTILMTPSNIGSMQFKNRFIFSACEDAMASEKGEVTDNIIRKNCRVAEGETALIISSHMYVHNNGRTRIRQTGIHDDSMITGLKKLTGEVHKYNCRIVFQLGHAGIQTPAVLAGGLPLGPSSDNPPDEETINEIIESFVKASLRAAEAGADGIQLHAAHGYLINQFLSPYYNRREDSWGGSDENRFRFLGEIIRRIKKVLPDKMIVIIKLNSNDYTPQPGITPELAAFYASRLDKSGIDGIEVSCGTSLTSPWNMCRGDVPVKELLGLYPESKRSDVEKTLMNIKHNFDISEGYNVEASILVKKNSNLE